MGVLFVYRAKSTGLAPPVFISRRIVFVFFYIQREQIQCDESKDLKGQLVIMSATSFKFNLRRKS